METHCWLRARIRAWPSDGTVKCVLLISIYFDEGHFGTIFHAVCPRIWKKVLHIVDNQRSLSRNADTLPSEGLRFRNFLIGSNAKVFSSD